VQVADSSGKVIKVGLKGWNALKPLSVVVVTGVVSKRVVDKDQVFVTVNATGIHVEAP